MTTMDMPLITLSRPSFRFARPSSAGGARRVVGIARRWMLAQANAFADYQRARQSLRVLASMSDELLRDVGVTRSEIDYLLAGF